MRIKCIIEWEHNENDFDEETFDGEQLVIPSKVRTNVIGNIHDNPELLEG